MTWTCPRCFQELGNYNVWCEYCKQSDNILIYNPDKYFIREICIYHIEQNVTQMTEKQGLTGDKLLEAIEADQRMTPQEKLYAKLYYHKRIFVKDMDRLTLRAHIEELSETSFKAKAEHRAAIDEDESRRKQDQNDNKVKGFERSLNTDETTTDAINTIKDRQKRLTKQEKIQAGLEKLGISPTNAAKLMTAGVILGRLNSKASGEVDKTNEQNKEENKPIFNPFEKKE